MVFVAAKYRDGRRVYRYLAVDEFMDWVLLFNLIFILVQSIDAALIPDVLPLSFIFTWIYVGEVGVKLSVKSWGHYWTEPANKFDFWTTWILVVSSLLKYLPFASFQANLHHYANILRLLRLLRVAKKLKNNPSFSFMVKTIVKMLTAAKTVMMLLGVVLFLFSTFSVNFFGGLLFDGNPVLRGTDYEEKAWFVFNFNDVIMAFVTWFTQLLCEYAPEWAEALDRAAGDSFSVPFLGSVAWYIYPTFYLVGVAIAFEILTAFMIETYLALKEEEDAAEGEEEESDSESEEEGEEPLSFVVCKVVQKRHIAENETLWSKTATNKTFRRKLCSAYAEALDESSKGEEGESK